MADPKGTSPEAIEEFNAFGRYPKTPDNKTNGTTSGTRYIPDPEQNKRVADHPTTPGAKGVGKLKG